MIYFKQTFILYWKGVHKIKYLRIIILVILLLNYSYTPALASYNSTENNELLNLRLDTQQDHLAQWQITINTDRNEIKQHKLYLTLTGSHVLDEQNLKTELDKHNINYDKTGNNTFVLEVSEDFEQASFFVKTTDTTKQSDNTMKISAVIDEVPVESSDIAHHFEDISVPIDYGNALTDEMPVIEVQLINTATKEVLARGTNTSAKSQINFEQVRMYDDENQKINYELSINPVEGFEIKEKDFSIFVKKAEEEIEQEPEEEIEETNKDELVEENKESLIKEPEVHKEVPGEKEVDELEEVEKENDKAEEAKAEAKEKATVFRSFSRNSVQPMVANNGLTYSDGKETIVSAYFGIVDQGHITMSLKGEMNQTQDIITWNFSIRYEAPLGRPSYLVNLSVSDGLAMPSNVTMKKNSESIKQVNISTIDGQPGINLDRLSRNDVTTITFVTPITKKGLDNYSLIIGNYKYTELLLSYRLEGITSTVTRISNPPIIKPVSNLDTTITGTARPGETVTIKNNAGTILGTAMANSSGYYQVTIPKQNVGTVLTATAKSSGSIQSEPTQTTVTGVFDLSIKKVNPNNAPLKGATFTLSGNNYNQSLTSDTNGNIRFPNLKPGTYTLTETSAPPGYIPDQTPHTIVIHVDGTITVNGLTIQGAYQSVSHPIVGSIQIKAIDFTDKNPLPGVKYQIKGTKVTATSDSNGILSFNDLPYGDYTLVMVEAPDGYNYDASEVAITLDKQTVLKEISLEKRMLPDTGGQGTLIFILIGGMLVFISIILKNKTNSGGI